MLIPMLNLDAWTACARRKRAPKGNDDPNVRIPRNDTWGSFRVPGKARGYIPQIPHT